MAIAEFMGEGWFRAPYMLGASDCETMSVQELLFPEPGAEDDLLRLRLGYSEPVGTPSLREAIADSTQGCRPMRSSPSTGRQRGSGRS